MISWPGQDSQQQKPHQLLGEWRFGVSRPMKEVKIMFAVAAGLALLGGVFLLIGGELLPFAGIFAIFLGVIVSFVAINEYIRASSIIDIYQKGILRTRGDKQCIIMFAKAKQLHLDHHYIKLRAVLSAKLSDETDEISFSDDCWQNARDKTKVMKALAEYLLSKMPETAVVRGSH
ncbi:MAG: DUF6585 family protein [Phycisphaeraceae bacterium]